MKIIASLLIALIFTLVGLLKFEGYFNVGTINLVGYDDTFDTNLSFLKTSTDYIYYIPDLIYNSERIGIKEFFSKFATIGNKEAYLFVIFLFFLIFSGFVTYILKYFPKRDDKIYLVLGIIISYFLIVEFMI